jgi:peroxiredoxin
MKKQLLFAGTRRFSMAAIFLALAIQLSGQNVRLTIDSPASISGEYGVNIAGFGPAICDLTEVNGDFALISDGAGGTLGCDTVMNDMSGLIAVIDRGVCNFSIKVFNAQQAGAKAVLVLNNNPDNGLITMAPGDLADQVTIPSFFMRTTDGETLKSALSEGVTGTFERIDVVDDFDGEVVYYEDFNGGFNGWSTTGLSCFGTGAENAAWEWVGGGSLQSDCFGTGFTTQSPTRCNGVLLFHSEFNDNLGDCSDGLGTGPCPAPQVAQLTSPPIDLTGSDAVSYSLRFHQLTAQFQSDYMVTWSTDGGITWDTSAVNTGLETFDLNVDPAVSVPMPGTGDADSIIVRLTYFANYYFWAIDDVQIIAQEANNLRVNEDFYAIPPNAQFPLSQAEPIPFLADIENVGALTQPNTTLNVSIFNQDGNEVFNEDLEYGNVPGNTLVENVPFGPTFVPADTGTFTGFYQIRSDSMDFDTTNNVQAFVFRATQNLFAKEGGATRPIIPAAGNWDAGEVHSWAYGNHFYVPNGEGQFIQTIQFALGDPANDAGQSIALSVYEWPDDANNDGIADRSEITQVGFDIYTITGNEAAGGIIEVPFPTLDDPIALKDDMGYLVMLEYYASDETTVSFAASEDFDYNASVFLSQVQGMPRYSGVLGIEGDLSTANFSTVGFGRDIVPTVRMTVGSEPITSTREPAQNLNDQFFVFPNPTVQQLNVRLALAEQADEARVEIFDMSGRLQWYRTWSRVRTEQLPVDVSDLPAGTYTVRIVTNNGVGSQRFMITGH